MTGILAERADEKRRAGEALIRQADNLACQSWNERMWSDGGRLSHLRRSGNVWTADCEGCDGTQPTIKLTEMDTSYP
jgi:hypothetical protein